MPPRRQWQGTRRLRTGSSSTFPTGGNERKTAAVPTLRAPVNGKTAGYTQLTSCYDAGTLKTSASGIESKVKVLPWLWYLPPCGVAVFRRSPHGGIFFTQIAGSSDSSGQPGGQSTSRDYGIEKRISRPDLHG